MALRLDVLNVLRPHAFYGPSTYVLWMQTLDALGSRSTSRRARRIVRWCRFWTENLFRVRMTDEICCITKFPAASQQTSPAVRKVAATRSPDSRRYSQTQADLLIADAEENRRDDIEQLLAALVPVSHLSRER